MPERLSDLGYLGIKKEATKGTAVIPDVFVPLYEETMLTEVNLDDDNPIVGNKAARFQQVLGQRTHMGQIVVPGEPNTAGYMFDMLLQKGTTTGAGPYTHPFVLDSNDPNSYTIEFLKGLHAFRFFGVEAKKIGFDFEANKMRLLVNISARGAFSVAEVSTITGTVGTQKITFKTNYDADPTQGLVVGDLLQIYDVSAGTYLNVTVDLITTADPSITVSEDVTANAVGDLVSIRTLSPSYTLQPHFNWARTEFRISDTAANALTAAQTGVEEGSDWAIAHAILPDEGARRSGSYDPQAMPRGLGDIEVSVKRFFDTMEDHNRFVTNQKRALVVRHFSDAISGTNQELRITLNDIRPSTKPNPLKRGELIFDEIEFSPQYDTSDAQMLDVVVINNVATI